MNLARPTRHSHSSDELLVLSLNSGDYLMVDWRERIEINPDVMTGKPVIKGTRLTVDHVIELLAEGWTVDQIIAEYPGVSPVDIAGCLAYASAVIKEEKVYPAHAV